MSTGGTFDSIDELPDDGEQQREVYARYGLAAYMAQVLEHGMVNLLVVAEQFEGKFSNPQAYDARLERLFLKTLGDLVRRAGAASRLIDDDLEICRRAAEQRNWLAHHFFRHHAADFLTPQGRQRMCDRADEARHLFESADVASSRIFHQVSALLGITPERINAEADRLLSPNMIEFTHRTRVCAAQEAGR